MKSIDLSILKKIPDLSKEAILEIQPLAPLSMVSELPGSYYKTLKTPDKKMICGMFENILGWHIDLADLKLIINDLKKHREKRPNQGSKLLFFDQSRGSTYIPLLMDYFKINLQLIPVTFFYDDLWSKAYSRADADVHPKGTFNLDFNIIPNKRNQTRDKDNPKKLDSAALFDFFKKNVNSYPQYYSTPTTREYAVPKGKYEIQITIDADLYTILLETLSYENIGYLGNNEGWVDLKILSL